MEKVVGMPVGMEKVGTEKVGRPVGMEKVGEGREKAGTEKVGRPVGMENEWEGKEKVGRVSESATGFTGAAMELAARRARTEATEMLENIFVGLDVWQETRKRENMCIKSVCKLWRFGELQRSVQ